MNILDVKANLNNIIDSGKNNHDSIYSYVFSEIGIEVNKICMFYTKQIDDLQLELSALRLEVTFKDVKE